MEAYQAWLNSPSKGEAGEGRQPIKNNSAPLQWYKVRKDGVDAPLPAPAPGAPSVPYTPAPASQPVPSPSHWLVPPNQPYYYYQWSYAYPWQQQYQYLPYYAAPTAPAHAPAPQQFAALPYYYIAAPPPAITAPPPENVWLGRTRSEVQRENQTIAAMTGGLENHISNGPQAPANAHFHVLEPDGRTQNTYPKGTIDGMSGYWNQAGGVWYFVRSQT